MYPITTAKLDEINRRWGAIFNRFRGPIPLGLCLTHAVAESNGNPTPAVTDQKRRAIGLMGVPLRTGLRFNRDEAQLANPTQNIFVWVKQTNNDGAMLCRVHPTAWTQGCIDYWLTVRLWWLCGKLVFDKLIAMSQALRTPNQVAETVLDWIDTVMPRGFRAGAYAARDLQEISTHLREVEKTIRRVDQNTLSTEFYAANPVTPGNAPNTTLTLQPLGE